MAKSSYSYQTIAINTDKYIDLRIKIKHIFDESSRRYGYRRIHSVLKTGGATLSEKVVRRIMNEENLIVPNIKRKRYRSCVAGTGELTHSKPQGEAKVFLGWSKKLIKSH